MIEAITKFCQIAREMFVIDRVIRSVNRSFDVTYHRIDPSVKDSSEAHSGPPPVTMLVCWHPASLTAVKQASPSETT